MSSTLESYELIRFAEVFEARLATAGEMLAGRPGLEPEKRWLADALELVRSARAPGAGVLDRVKDLPELEEAREEYAFHQQGLWVDALEKLHAGITFTASSRAPVIEALFPHLKFPQLRRAPRDAVIEYATSYERRTKSSYVSRIFARDDFALVRPVMEQVSTAHAAWRSSHEPAPLTPEVEAVLREELVSLGRKLDVALRQARLLSEAAMVPVPSVFEAAGLGIKPKRRAGRGLGPAADEGAGFSDEPVDSMEPTEAELAELEAGGADVAPDSAAGDAAAPPAAGPEAQAAAGDTATSDEAEAGGPGDTEEAAAPRAEAIAEAGAVDSTADGSSLAAPGDPAPAPRGDDAGRGPGTRASRAGRRSEPTTKAGAASGAGAPDNASGEEPTPEAGASTAGSLPGEDATAPARGARKGRKKADTSPTSEPESAEAQAPRVRKKKASAPGASGEDTP